MPGANLIFHTGSAILLGVLIYQMLHFKKQRDFLRKMLKQAANTDPIVIDTPSHFLRQYCQALNLSFDDSAAAWPKNWTVLQKIKYGSLLSLQRQFSLAGISPIHTDDGQIQLGLHGASLTANYKPEQPNSLDLGFAQVQVLYS